jgi:hypothetical protein
MKMYRRRNIRYSVTRLKRIYCNFFSSLLAIRITLHSVSYFAVILYDVKRLIQK